MALTAAQKRKAGRWYAYTIFKREKRTAVITQTQINNAIDAIDVWLDTKPNSSDTDNESAFRAAVPGPVRTALNPPEVLLLLAAVVMGRTSSKAMDR